MPNRVAFTQCSARSRRSNRRRGGSGWSRSRRAARRAARSSATVMRGSGGTVVPPVRTADPAVDVVAALLPVALLDRFCGLDVAEPLARLVPVHGRDVEPGGAAVLVGERRALELVGDDHVVATGLREGEALGVRTVEGMEPQRGGPRLHAGAVEEVGEAHALPLDLGHPPPGDALEVP